jgi:hypothetical protein
MWNITVVWVACKLSLIANSARCNSEIKCKMALTEASFNLKTFHQQIWLKFKEEINKLLHLEHSFVWCWNLDTAKVDQKCLENYEMWCWRRMEKISWTDRVRKEQINCGEERNILHTINRTTSNWIGNILRRNYLLKHVIERKKW